MMNTLSLFAVVSTILTTALINSQRIVNQSYKRTVYFTGAVVREEHMIEVDVQDESPMPANNIPEDLVAELHQNWFPNYVFLVPEGQAKSLASWDANLIINRSDASTSTLPITEITAEVESCQKYGYRCLNVVLPMEGSLHRSFLISVSLAFVDQLVPNPAIQKDMTAPIRLLYRSDSLVPISVYQTIASQTIFAITKKSKSLKLKCPIGRKPEKANGINLPMEMKAFICNGNTNGPVEFRYESKDITMLRITKLERKFTYLPWSGEVQVKESYEYVHEGPKQPESPSFSRIDYTMTMQNNFGNLEGLQIVPRVLAVVPKSAKTLQVRDEVGIIWAETSRNEVEEDVDVVQIPLRFPLIGGMSCAFDFYYTIDASELIKPFKASSSPFKKLIQMPMFRPVFDVPIDYFKLIFVLPEDTADIEYEMATSKPVKVTQRKFRSYFSTTGEKEISFEFQKMTREDLEKGIALLFNYPFWGAFRKPLVAFSSFIFLIIGALYVNRINLSLQKKNQRKSKFSNSDVNTGLKNLFNKRREILMNYEDLIAGNMNNRPTAEQVKRDLNSKTQLDNQMMTLQNAIFEKVKNQAYPDQQKTALNSMALKRLYDEQNEICGKILMEVSDNLRNSASNDSISSAKSSVSIFSRTSMNMSQSCSADLLSASRSNKAIEDLSKDAVKLDCQVSEYENKFLLC
jgi:hypothetical protein